MAALYSSFEAVTGQPNGALNKAYQIASPYGEPGAVLVDATGGDEQLGKYNGLGGKLERDEDVVERFRLLDAADDAAGLGQGHEKAQLPEGNVHQEKSIYPLLKIDFT